MEQPLPRIDDYDDKPRPPYFTALAYIGGALALIALFGFATLFLTQVNITSSRAKDADISPCVEKYLLKFEGSDDDIQRLYTISSYCYNSIGSQLKLDQEVIRRDNFIFQRNENVILLVMVVLITIGGVVLAGLQLLASYKLAVVGRGELAGGAEIGYNPGGASFKSSVVGLTILALSFSFFIVFVKEVYTLIEVGNSQSTASRPVEAPQVQRPLFPARPPPPPEVDTRVTPPLSAPEPGTGSDEPATRPP